MIESSPRSYPLHPADAPSSTGFRGVAHTFASWDSRCRSACLAKRVQDLQGDKHSLAIFRSFELFAISGHEGISENRCVVAFARWWPPSVGSCNRCPAVVCFQSSQGAARAKRERAGAGRRVRARCALVAKARRLRCVTDLDECRRCSTWLSRIPPPRANPDNASTLPVARTRSGQRNPSRSSSGAFSASPGSLCVCSDAHALEPGPAPWGEPPRACGRRESALGRSLNNHRRLAREPALKKGKRKEALQTPRREAPLEVGDP